MSIEYYLYLSLMLFTIGVFGVLIRRNMIIIFMCIELMLNSVNLLLVAFSKYHYNFAMVTANKSDELVGTDAQVFVFFTMLVAAAEVSVGLAILTMIFKNTKSINISHLFRLRH